MENNLNLDDVLNEGSVPQPEPEQEPEQQAEPEAVEQPQGGPQRDDKGRFASKGDKEDAPPASEDKASKGLEAGITAERKKRQEVESQLEALRRELEEMRQPKEPPAPPPSIWEDDQAALNHWQGQAVSTAVQQATFNARLDMSEMMARQQFDDFEEMKSEFVRMMQENPALQQQALSDPHPWNKAYQIAKNARTMSELGATNIDELKAQLLEQLKAEQAAQAPAAPNLPRSLADAQSAKGNNAPAPAPISLEEILGR